MFFYGRKHSASPMNVPRVTRVPKSFGIAYRHSTASFYFT